MITEDYVSFEIAKLLKEKGFENSEPTCINVFKGHTYKIQDNEIIADDDITIPTLQMAMKWLREVHNIHIAVNLTYSEEPKLFPPEYYVYIDNTLTGEPLIKEVCSLVQDETLTPKGFKHSEEACEAAIKYCLENLI